MHGLMEKGAPPMPRWIFFVKIAILVLSLLILALAAYAVSIFGSFSYYYYSSGAGGLLIFVAIKTFIVFGGLLAVEIWAPLFYYRLVALIAYILSLIFWLSAWAWAASSASAWLSLTQFGFYDEAWRHEGGALAACAAFGAVVWILSIVHLVFFVRACLHDSHAGAHSQAELGQVKHAQQTSTTTNTTTYPQQQQQYATQEHHTTYPAQQ